MHRGCIFLSTACVLAALAAVVATDARRNSTRNSPQSQRRGRASSALKAVAALARGTSSKPKAGAAQDATAAAAPKSPPYRKRAESTRSPNAKRAESARRDSPPAAPKPPVVPKPTVRKQESSAAAPSAERERGRPERANTATREPTGKKRAPSAPPPSSREKLSDGAQVAPAALGRRGSLRRNKTLQPGGRPPAVRGFFDGFECSDPPVSGPLDATAQRKVFSALFEAFQDSPEKEPEYEPRVRRLKRFDLEKLFGQKPKVPFEQIGLVSQEKSRQRSVGAPDRHILQSGESRERSTSRRRMSRAGSMVGAIRRLTITSPTGSVSGAGGRARGRSSTRGRKPSK